MSDRELEALTKELDRMRRENAVLRAMATEKFGELDIVVTPDGAALLRTWAKAPQHVALLVEMGKPLLATERLRAHNLGVHELHEIALAATKHTNPIEASDEMIRKKLFDREGWARDLGGQQQLGEWTNPPSDPKNDYARAMRTFGVPARPK